MATRCQTLSTDDCLEFCRNHVTQLVQEAHDHEALCAVGIEATYCFLQSEESSGRFVPGTTARWLIDTEAKLGLGAIKKKIEAGMRHNRRLATSQAIVSKNWNVSLYDIMTDVRCTKTISESLAKSYARLSHILPLDDARIAIQEAINYRKKTTTSAVDHVCNRDIDGILSRFPEGLTRQHRRRSASAAFEPLPPTPQHDENKNREDNDHTTGGVNCHNNSVINIRGVNPSSISHNAQQAIKDTVGGVLHQSERQEYREDDEQNPRGSAPPLLQAYGKKGDSHVATVNLHLSSEDEEVGLINPNTFDHITRRKRKAKRDRSYHPIKKRCSSLPSPELARVLEPSLTSATMEDIRSDFAGSGHEEAGEDFSEPEVHMSITTDTLPNVLHNDDTQFDDSWPHLSKSNEQESIEFTRLDLPTTLDSGSDYVSVAKTVSSEIQNTNNGDQSTQEIKEYDSIKATSLNDYGPPVVDGGEVLHSSFTTTYPSEEQQQNEDMYVATNAGSPAGLPASLAMLSQGQKLNADTLVELLRLFYWGHCQVLDPAQVKPQVERLADPHSRQKHRVADSPLTVMVYHDEEASHWSLGVFRPNLRTIHYLDSLSILGVESKAKEACLATLKWLGIAVMDVAWEAQGCLQQTDGVSCGLHLVENVRAVLAADPIPTQLDIDELRSRYRRELRIARTSPKLGAIPAAVTDPLILPLSHSTSSSQDVDCIILQKKLEQQQDLVSKANEQRITLLQQSKVLESINAELLQLHTDLMEAETTRLWNSRNCENAHARLQAFERHPVFPQPGSPIQATEAVVEYNNQLLVMRNRLSSEQVEQRRGIELVQRKKTSWQACRELQKEKMGQFRKTVELWQAWFNFVGEHSRLLGINQK
ncbi:MAG: hypothetical protein Q9182_005515, partial [Xanthomendoza sp. 2 TL-2023]